MNKCYEVSVIIPIYNVEKYVAQSLNSALNQTFKSIEFVLVDDCGTDKSMEVVNNVIYNHPRKNDIFIYRHEKNSGLSAARNTGLLKATGKYIFFMDSDDEISTNCIQLHYDAILRTGADFTVGFVKLEGVKSIHLNNINFGLLHGRDIMSKFLKKDLLESAWNKLYRKTFISDYRLEFVPNLLHEDILWGINICLYASCVVCVPEHTYIYKIRTSSITTTSCSEKRLESLIFIVRYLNSRLETFTQNEDEKILFKKYVSHILFVLMLLLQTSKLSSNKKKELYYNLVNENKFCLSGYTKLLNLPYSVFYMICFLPYKAYKKLQ